MSRADITPDIYVLDCHKLDFFKSSWVLKLTLLTENELNRGSSTRLYLIGRLPTCPIAKYGGGSVGGKKQKFCLEFCFALQCPACTSPLCMYIKIHFRPKLYLKAIAE